MVIPLNSKSTCEYKVVRRSSAPAHLHAPRLTPSWRAVDAEPEGPQSGRSGGRPEP